MHCFTETWELAKKAMEMNYYISFAGMVTFKNADRLRQVAQLVPLDRMLIETDAPYLSPVPHRGKPNQPAYVHYVADCLAELKNVPKKAFAGQICVNFFKLFNINF